MSAQTYLLQAVTALRVGDGAAVGSVNLPLTRERHTGWPVVPGASIKGALRQRAAWRVEGDHAGEAALRETFGGTPEEADAAGAARFGPAHLLALPTRCLKGTFVLLSSPMALARFARQVGGEAPTLPAVRPGTIALPPKLDIAVEGSGLTLDPDVQGLVVLEEVALSARRPPEVAAWGDWLAKWTAEEAPVERLAVVHDDLFTHATRYWTEFRTRAAIGRDGVVEQGKLFTVELLPVETLLWGTLGAAGGAALLPEDGEVWTLGGHQSAGMGRVAWYRRTA